MDPIIAATWADFTQNRNNISIYIGDSVVHKAKDVNTAYKQVNAFLLNSIPYDKPIPKNDEGVAGCAFGSVTEFLPALVISDKQHTMSINPAYYLKKNYDDTNIIEFIPGVLSVNIDDKIKFIQNRSFYNWLNNMQWQPYFYPALSFNESVQPRLRDEIVQAYISGLDPYLNRWQQRNKNSRLQRRRTMGRKTGPA